jgi:hypothetical protein
VPILHTTALAAGLSDLIFKGIQVWRRDCFKNGVTEIAQAHGETIDPLQNPA